jgi:hypothetical protein
MKRAFGAALANERADISDVHIRPMIVRFLPGASSKYLLSERKKFAIYI